MKNKKAKDGFRQKGEHILETTGGGGCLSFAGLFFLSFGSLFLLFMVFQDQGNLAGQIVGGSFGGLFALIGAFMVFGRWGIKIDRGQGQIFAWYGVGLLGLNLPLKTKIHPLADFDHVSITSQVHKTRGNRSSNSKPSYPVSIAGKEEPLQLEIPQDYSRARALAEQAAKFLNLDIHDSSSGESIVRQAAFLDESLRQKALRTGETVSAKPRPINMRSRVELGAGMVDIVVPPSGITLFHGVGLALAIILTAISYFFSSWFPSIFIILFIGLAILRHAFKGIKIRADRQGLWLTKTWFGLGKTRHIPTNELEELLAKQSLPDGLELSEVPEKHRALVHGLINFFVRPKLVARSDRQILEASGAVSGAEMEYLLSLVKREMTR